MDRSTSMNCQIDHEKMVITVDGKIVNYQSVSLHDGKLGNLVQQGRDGQLLLTEELDRFDRFDFSSRLAAETLACLERLSLPHCLQVLQTIPLQMNYVANILNRVSVNKLVKLLEDDYIFRHLFGMVHQLTHKCLLSADQAQLLDIHLKVELKQAHKRLLFWLETVNVQKPLLRDALQNALGSVVCDYHLGGFGFIQRLYETSINGQQNSSPFLENCVKMLRTVFSLKSKSGVNLSRLRDKAVASKILNRKFYKIVSANFDHYFNYERQALTKLLTICFGVDAKQAWGKLFCDTFVNNQNALESSVNSETVSEKDSITSKSKLARSNNRDKLFDILVSNLFGFDEELKESTLVLIEKMIFSPDSCTFLLDVMQEFLEQELGCEQCKLVQKVLEASLQFGRVDKSLKTGKLTQYAQKMLEELNHRVISRTAKNFPKSWQKTQTRLLRNKIDAKLFIEYFRIYGTLLACQEQLGIKVGQESIEAMRCLLLASSGQKGAIFGVRKSFQTIVRTAVSRQPQVEVKDTRPIRLRPSKSDSSDDSIDFSDSEQETQPEASKYTSLMMI